MNATDHNNIDLYIKVGCLEAFLIHFGGRSVLGRSLLIHFWRSERNTSICNNFDMAKYCYNMEEFELGPAKVKESKMVDGESGERTEITFRILTDQLGMGLGAGSECSRNALMWRPISTKLETRAVFLQPSMSAQLHFTSVESPQTNVGRM